MPASQCFFIRIALSIVNPLRSAVRGPQWRRGWGLRQRQMTEFIRDRVPQILRRHFGVQIEQRMTLPAVTVSAALLTVLRSGGGPLDGEVFGRYRLIEVI